MAQTLLESNTMIDITDDSERSQGEDGYNAMPLSCLLNGRIEDLEALAKSCPELCLEKDKNGRTPLHIAAVMDGREDVVRALVTACPESLEQTTSRGETALHLALKNGQCLSFQVLMEELHKLRKEAILTWKDYEGNTVLHIATKQRLVQIVRMLLVDNSKYGPLVQVKAKNARGMMASDLLYQNNPKKIDKHLSELLHDAEAMEGPSANCGKGQASHSQLPQPESPRTMNRMVLENTSLMRKSVLLMVFVFIAGTAYACLFNLNNIYPFQPHVGSKTLRIKDKTLAPYLLPDVFYFIVLDKFTFVASMGVILINTWSLVKKCSFCYRILPVFVMSTMFISYAVLLKDIVPKFWVAMGSIRISSYWLVWLYDLPLILFLALIWMVVKLCIFSESSGKLKTSGNLSRIV
ncbi:hypothetical protein F0562_031441 [Nyssa sinensis]|uniref:Uncharacterized protein n=1 Tax=Nyssa sinensis TaxID=561372 RepID=A0A5J5AUH0_9ASTE|nr:hypothetical protein F0562_031441 [Nyssa sinensis]